MKNPWVTFTGICTVVVAIVVFCVVLGGYSSFLRSQGRIQQSGVYLLDACRETNRLALKLMTVNENAGKGNPAEVERLKGNITAAAKFLDSMAIGKAPIPLPILEKMALRQHEVTLGLAGSFQDNIQFNSKEEVNQYTALIRHIHAAQDNLFVVKKRYNSEVAYFHSRTTVFPGFLIARLFGFDAVVYHLLPADKFLPAHKVYPPKP